LNVRQPALILALVVLAGCASRPAEKSRLERLNGENYAPDSTMSVGTVPVYIGKQEARLTKVSGTVWSGTGIERTPIARAHVFIEKDGKVLAEADSEPNGQYKLFHILPDGRYLLRAELGERKAQTDFEVHGYEVKDLDLNLQGR
jgi:hypothetical protein